MTAYLWYELNHAALSPFRAAADVARLYFKNPLNPLSQTHIGKNIAAGCELFERVTRRYGKPEFGLSTTNVGGRKVAVEERIIWSQPFCNLLHFEKSGSSVPQPKLLIVAPMSGHYATLLRGTVEDMLPKHDVYITDWIDARMVPAVEGSFDLDDFIDYIINMLHFLGGETHIMAVCQPSVPALAAAAVMNENGDPYAPLSMTLMGGPIDTRENPTVVNTLAQERGIDWFARNVITKVPFPHAGVMRSVYPGFLQLSGFMSMNLDRHINAHREFFQHLIDGDGDSAEKHKEFYDEYMAVMDLTAEFYLQTVDEVFIRHSLPEKTFSHRGRIIDCGKITNTALMTVEGEKDDISGIGQTKAAHKLCSNLSEDMKVHYEQPRVGHYGVFNGSRFRAEIAPRIADFILTNDPAIRKARDTRKMRPAAAPAAKPKTVKVAVTAAAGEAPAAKARTAPKPARKAAAKSAANGPFLKAPDGEPDDLKLISGIGPKLEKTLNDLGVYHFRQIAGWSRKDCDTVDGKLTFKGRIGRDDWVGQAKVLTAKQQG